MSARLSLLAMKNLLPTIALVAMSAVYSQASSPVCSPGSRLDTHEDDLFGFRFRTPRGWRSIPMQSGEAWLVAKYLSDKSYTYVDEVGDDHVHTPQVMVIAFQHEVQERRTRRGQEEAGTGSLRRRRPMHSYKDYEDFLDRTYAGGGWYLDDKEEGRSGKLAVTRYGIKVEKLARTGPKRIITWVYHGEDIDFAVQFEVLEGQYRKLRRTVESSLKSFSLIKRRQGLLPDPHEVAGSMELSDVEVAALPPKERARLREQSQRDLHEAVIEGLTDGWSHRYHGEVLVLHREETKWARRLGDHAELVLDYLDDTFDYIGEGEFTRAPVIRVCDDEEQAAAFSHGVIGGVSLQQRIWAEPGKELVTFKDERGWSAQNGEVEQVNRQLLHCWLTERDEALYQALPRWISIGIEEYIGGARADGRRLEFPFDQFDRDEAKRAAGAGSATSTHELIHLTREAFGSNSDSGDVPVEVYRKRRGEATMLVHWLLGRESRGCRQAKRLVQDYLVALDVVLCEEREREASLVAEVIGSEEREDELARTRALAVGARESRIQGEVNRRVFEGWSGGDWTNLDRQFLRWL